MFERRLTRWERVREAVRARMGIGRARVLTLGERLRLALWAAALGAALAAAAGIHAALTITTPAPARIRALAPVLERSGDGLTVVRLEFAGGEVSGWCHLVIQQGERQGWTLRC